MLKIVRSGFGGKDRHNIAALLRASIESCNKCYLIVPEQQTVMAESEMALLLPKNAPLYFEATNFTRFADTVLRALGGLSGEYCDSGKRALIMWRALTELAPTLSITSRGEVNAGIVDQSLRAVAEMENLGITPDALARSASMVSSDKRLSDKLSDISKIYTLYKSLINERYSDSNDAVNFTVKRLWDKPDYLRGANVIIDGFTSFTEAQYALIARLAARCSVTVYLPIPKGDREGFEFKEILRAENRLKTYAAREGADVSLKKEDGRFNTSSELLSELPYAIWKINPVFDYKGLQNKEELRIFEAQTPFEECDFVASDIRRRVMDGAKYSDFAIIARSADKYTGVIDGSLSGADIPFFTSTRTDVSSLEAVKLIYTAFAIIKSGFRREDVITYAKCGFSGISREECDELEIYADVWQINGRRFTDGIDWNMRISNSYSVILSMQITTW
jgi:ATP-dependent helicase/nuclease subunit B